MNEWASSSIQIYSIPDEAPHLQTFINKKVIVNKKEADNGS